LLHGGDQQRGRSGTMDVAGAVAFATALELSQERREPHLEHLRALQAQLIAGVREAIPDAVLRGAPEGEERLPSNVHFTFPGCQGDSLLFLLDQRGFSVSTGSACHAGVAEVSHVLIAMGIDEETALGALRFTLGETNTAEQIDELVSILPELVALARQAGVNTAS
jgi:cysteine desulfurase